MVNIQRLLHSLPWLQITAAPKAYTDYSKPAQNVLGAKEHFQTLQDANTYRSIAIVGAGSSGLSAIKTFLDVADALQQSWRIVVFEQRRDVGGVWYVIY